MRYALLGVAAICSSLAVAAEPMEPLLGLSADFGAGTLTLVVVSTGCTEKGDFRVKLDDGVLKVERLRVDACKAMPMKAPITWTLDELGISPHTPFHVGNPFLVNEYIATN